MNSNNAALIVPPSLPDLATNDIRAIRPPVDIPNEWVWFWWLLAVLLLAGAAVASYFWMKRKAALPAPIAIVPPHVRARQQLDSALRFIHDPRLFCTLVSDAIRLYLEERFQFHAPERTTEEFLSELQHTNRLLPDQKLSLAEFLENCDLVKFARFEPNESALQELHGAAVRLVDETQYDALGPAPGEWPSSSPPSAGPPGSSSSASSVPPPPPPPPASRPGLAPPPVPGSAVSPPVARPDEAAFGQPVLFA